MSTPINNRALMRLLYTFGGFGSLVTGWILWILYGKSASIHFCTIVLFSGVRTRWGFRFKQRSHPSSDSISLYAKPTTQATSQMSNRVPYDIEYYLQLASDASLILWVFIFTLRVSELKMHGFRINIRVVQKTVDLPRRPLDATSFGSTA